MLSSLSSVFQLHVQGGSRQRTTVTTVAAAAALLCAWRLLASRKKPQGRRMRAPSLGTTRLMSTGILPEPDRGDYDMLINASMTFEELPDMGVVIEQFQHHIVPYKQFHCVPVQAEDGGEITWVPRRIVPASHFFSHTIPNSNSPLAAKGASAPTALLREKIDEIMAKGLRSKGEGQPWWEVHRLHVDGDRGGIIVVRMHHALGDGISIMEVFAEAITDQYGEKLPLGNLFNPARGRKSGGPVSKNVVVRLVRGLIGMCVTVLKAPFVAFDVLRNVGAVLGLTIVGCDTSTCFQNESRHLPYKNNRFSVYFPSHSLDLIKEIKNRLSKEAGSGKKPLPITVNDVEFALFAGAVRRYVARNDGAAVADSMQLRALTPLAFPQPSDDLTRHATLLRNFWTFVFNKMPTQEKDAKARIFASHSSWDRIKHTTLVPVALALHKLASSLPHAAQQQTTCEMNRRCGVVFSNVPGPQCPVYFCGAEVKAVHMLYPNIPQQVGILSIDGRVHMALVMATKGDRAVPQKELPADFLDELVEAAASVGIDKSEVMAGVDQA